MNNYKNGLSNKEVETLIKEGKTNKTKRVKGKSHLKIIVESFFTFFNIVLYVLALVFLFFEIFYPNGLKYIPITKYGFLFTILCNATVSIVTQEISKHTLEKMRLISDPKVKVIREGKEILINNDDVVLGDTIVIKSGEVIPADLILKEGELSVNESMLTGESNAIRKRNGDTLYAGSYCLSGYGYLVADKVGKDRYISTIESKVENIKKKRSKLLDNIYKIIRILLLFVLPLTIGTAIKMWYVGATLTDPINGLHWVFTPEVITKAAATLVGMIPIGMILLSSITLSESIIKLSKKKTMVQELYAIENLSRVDTLCLDKTGTLTTQCFKFVGVIKFKEFDDNTLIFNHFNAIKDVNKTALAIKKEFKDSKIKKEVLKIEDFSSTSKSSKVFYKDGTFTTIGAPEFVFNDIRNINSAKKYAKKGYRVIGIKENDEELGIILLKDELRKGIKETLNYFSDLNIDIKIISGDDPLTVKEISKEAGVKNYDNFISMENVKIEDIKTIANKYTIFGRTSPDQKQEIIRCLENNGNTVGYVGDGVNDVTSLRQADCSIALENGADSTKAVSDVVLLDNDFSHLPDVFKEGRRVIRNIQRSILLFLSKTFFIGIFSFVSLFLPYGLPIEIEAIYIYEFISIALCGLLLSIQNSIPEAVKDDFVSSVLWNSFIFGAFMSFSGFIPIIINAISSINNYQSLIVVFTTISGLLILIKVCYPFKKYTLGVALVGIVCSIIAALAFPDVFLNPGYLKQASNLKEQFALIFRDFFNLNLYFNLSFTEWITIMIYVILAPIVFFLIFKLKSYLEMRKEVDGKNI